MKNFPSNMTEKDLLRLLSLCRDMAAVIDKYQRHMKPREADKARQARRLLRKAGNVNKHYSPTKRPLLAE